MRKELIGGNDIIGGWESENKEVRMQINKNAELACFNGKITWIIEDEANPDEPTLDAYNPDDALKQRPIAGLEFIKGLTFFEKKKEWNSGQLYNPEDGKTYHLRVWLIDKDTLNIKPSVDTLGLLGKSFKWYRLSD